jgi:hypothetical protein
VLLQRNKENIQRFVRRHAKHPLTDREKTKLLRLMEMQRHCMLMFTSCAWFFAEISGIETNQVLQYAMRAMYYARYVAKLDLQEEFTRRLEKAPSNIYENGAVSFKEHVVPTQMSLTRVGMHYAASSIFEDYEDTSEFLHYIVKNEVFERIPAGFQRLAIGRTTVISQLTYSEKCFSFAVLYLGQQHIIGSIALDLDRADFDKMKDEITATFRKSRLSEVIGLLQTFGDEKFSFDELFKDEKRKILFQLMEKSLPPVETVIRDYYDDNYQLIIGMMDSNIPLPEGWRNVTQYIVNRDLNDFFRNGKMNIRKLQFLVEEYARWGIRLSDPTGLSLAAGERIFHELKKLEKEESGLEQINALIKVLEVLIQLGIEPELWKSQNLYYQMTMGYRRGDWVYVHPSWERAFLRLGELLEVKAI